MNLYDLYRYRHIDGKQLHDVQLLQQINGEGNLGAGKHSCQPYRTRTRAFGFAVAITNINNKIVALMCKANKRCAVEILARDIASYTFIKIYFTG